MIGLLHIWNYQNLNLKFINSQHSYLDRNIYSPYFLLFHPCAEQMRNSSVRRLDSLCHSTHTKRGAHPALKFTPILTRIEQKVPELLLWWVLSYLGSVLTEKSRPNVQQSRSEWQKCLHDFRISEIFVILVGNFRPVLNCTFTALLVLIVYFGPELLASKSPCCGGLLI